MGPSAACKMAAMVRPTAAQGGCEGQQEDVELHPRAERAGRSFPLSSSGRRSRQPEWHAGMAHAQARLWQEGGWVACLPERACPRAAAGGPSTSVTG